MKIFYFINLNNIIMLDISKNFNIFNIKILDSLPANRKSSLVIMGGRPLESNEIKLKNLSTNTMKLVSDCFKKMSL